MNPFSEQTETLVLQLLKDTPDGLFGSEVVQWSNGQVTEATVYVVLGRLEQDGAVESRPERDTAGVGVSRPRFRITKWGSGRLDAIEVGGMHFSEA